MGRATSECPSRASPAAPEYCRCRSTAGEPSDLRLRLGSSGSGQGATDEAGAAEAGAPGPPHPCAKVAAPRAPGAPSPHTGSAETKRPCEVGCSRALIQAAAPGNPRDESCAEGKHVGPEPQACVRDATSCEQLGPPMGASTRQRDSGHRLAPCGRGARGLQHKLRVRAIPMASGATMEQRRHRANHTHTLRGKACGGLGPRCCNAPSPKGAARLGCHAEGAWPSCRRAFEMRRLASSWGRQWELDLRDRTRASPRSPVDGAREEASVQCHRCKQSTRHEQQGCSITTSVRNCGVLLW